ncbi:MAG: N-methyl-L-tryptophan oxidase [SAR202 cluster bacterium]|nr:N-methyl-L-tryptophan oxidase [Chloroflexota bacterium]MDP6425822.1 N-methyl-L-tryptophan oxidase [Dehalococcoidia bacterium]MDP7613011.1 N-methyl-L-tryptophan oxidase [Dehalococcoidia bacterium]MQG47511.1 N-methyl-L-tryptophan oxidase [SAR202 cluster bacterium]
MSDFDAIVVGIGSMGSSTLYHLAQRRKKVLGIEQFGIPHELGSYHGESRIIRLAYYEDPSYVPLLKRAYELWFLLQNQVKAELLCITGSLDIDRIDGSVFKGSLTSCLTHNIVHEVLDAKEISSRFPGYELPSDYYGLYQPDGGFLFPEKCVEAYKNMAIMMGADVKVNERVKSWKSERGKVIVTTDKDVYRADKIVFTSGAWTQNLLSDTSEILNVERQVVGWFTPENDNVFKPELFPVFNAKFEEGRYYGFPITGTPGFKVGRYHHLGQIVDPDFEKSEITVEDELILRSAVSNYFPKANGDVISLKSCMFTNTSDEHFILDRVPGYGNVFLAAGFSGHGFKFSSVVGEIMADLVTYGKTKHDINMFRVDRF